MALLAGWEKSHPSRKIQNKLLALLPAYSLQCILSVGRWEGSWWEIESVLSMLRGVFWEQMG